MHLAIVGAGIIGMPSAQALLDDGDSVTLIDRIPDDGMPEIPRPRKRK